MLQSSRGTPDHGVEPDIRVEPAFVLPGLLTVLELDDAWRPVGEMTRHAPFEQVGRLDQMVVHRDDRDPDPPGLGIGQERH